MSQPGGSPNDKRKVFSIGEGSDKVKKSRFNSDGQLQKRLGDVKSMLDRNQGDQSSAQGGQSLPSAANPVAQPTPPPVPPRFKHPPVPVKAEGSEATEQRPSAAPGLDGKTGARSKKRKAPQPPVLSPINIEEKRTEGPNEQGAQPQSSLDQDAPIEAPEIRPEPEHKVESTLVEPEGEERDDEPLPDLIEIDLFAEDENTLSSSAGPVSADDGSSGAPDAVSQGEPDEVFAVSETKSSPAPKQGESSVEEPQERRDETTKFANASAPDASLVSTNASTSASVADQISAGLDANNKEEPRMVQEMRQGVEPEIEESHLEQSNERDELKPDSNVPTVLDPEDLSPDFGNDSSSCEGPESADDGSEKAPDFVSQVEPTEVLQMRLDPVPADESSVQEHVETQEESQDEATTASNAPAVGDSPYYGLPSSSGADHPVSGDGSDMALDATSQAEPYEEPSSVPAPTPEVEAPHHQDVEPQIQMPDNQPAAPADFSPRKVPVGRYASFCFALMESLDDGNF